MSAARTAFFSPLLAALGVALVACASQRATPATNTGARAAVAAVEPSASASAAPEATASASAAPEPSPWAALPGWSADATAAVLPAWRRSCARLLRTSDARALGPDGLAGTAAAWKPACRAVPPEGASDDAARAYFERWFYPVRVTADGGREAGLFTGYYEPELRGSRVRTRRYRVPLYPVPRDRALRRGRYLTRAQIARGALRRRATPLLYVDDPIEAFFLEIQGSGRVVFEDGTSVYVNYAGHNGHPYVALGRVLIDRGALTREQVSLQSIRAWLAAHPAQAQAVMNENPSYVFFRENPAGGSHGAEGVTLEPGRSLAVDRRYLPLGAPVYLAAEALAGVGPIERLLVAQDTGGAIRGVVRGDLFWGAGPEAYDRAGRMRQRGRYWLLLPRGVPEPVWRAPDERPSAPSPLAPEAPSETPRERSAEEAASESAATDAGSDAPVESASDASADGAQATNSTPRG